jgi:hypothetical protein
MVGVVTTRHLLIHSAVIIREFGALCLFRCFWRTLTADRAVTFLECVATTGGPRKSAQLCVDAHPVPR